MSEDSLATSLNTLIHLLQAYPAEGELAHVVAIALAKISLEQVNTISPLSNGEGMPSAEVVSIYDLRKRMNYFLGKHHQGIDETLKTLSTHDRPIKVRCIEMQKSIIAIWTENNYSSLCGIMILNGKSSDSLGLT